MNLDVYKSLKWSENCHYLLGTLDQRVWDCDCLSMICVNAHLVTDLSSELGLLLTTTKHYYHLLHILLCSYFFLSVLIVWLKYEAKRNKSKYHTPGLGGGIPWKHKQCLISGNGWLTRDSSCLAGCLLLIKITRYSYNILNQQHTYRAICLKLITHIYVLSFHNSFSQFGYTGLYTILKVKYGYVTMRHNLSIQIPWSF